MKSTAKATEIGLSAWTVAAAKAAVLALIPAGSEVFNFTSATLDAAGITPDDLDVFIPHQANMRITDAMVRSLKLPERVVVARDIATTGNTSGASIPVAMSRMLEAGEITSGQTALLIGFGAGLVYASQVVTIP